MKRESLVEISQGEKHRPMLRNANINYSRGTFFVTMQAAFNKTIFGAIVGEKCVLNGLGEAIAACLRALGERYAGVEIDEFVVMPNHVHFLIKIGVAGLCPRLEKASLRARPEKAGVGGHSKIDLSFVIGRFKSWISKLYRDMVAEGKAVDVGATPWQRDFWEKLVTTPEQLEGYRRYIRENPAKWTRDRFGAVTSYTFGNVALLNARLIGFVASQGAYTSELRPRQLWVKARTEPRHPEQIGEAYPPSAASAEGGAMRGGLCPRDKPPLISTFTSAQERSVFAKALASGRRFVKVCPGGIPLEGELEPAVAAACNEGRGLLISPAPSGTGVNKQRAVWCNEYILKNAAEVWAGDITPGHTLASLVAALRPPMIAVPGGERHDLGVAGDERHDLGVAGDERHDLGVAGGERHDLGVAGDERHDLVVAGDERHDLGVAGLRPRQ